MRTNKGKKARIKTPTVIYMNKSYQRYDKGGKAKNNEDKSGTGNKSE